MTKNLDLKNEIWKTINEFEDYQISNFGRIKSFKYDKINGKIIKQTKNNGGYFQIKLYKNNKYKSKYIHILMYELFKNHKLKNNECIHHIDFTKYNILDNLQLMTKKEHGILHTTGKHFSDERKRKISENHADVKGENNPRSILKKQDVIQIKILLKEKRLTQREIGKIFCTNSSTVSNIKNNRIWKHVQI